MPERTHPGDTGPAVRDLQAWLCRQGYSVAVDGRHGPLTEAAVVLALAAQGVADDAALAVQGADARTRMVALARSYVGCSQADPDRWLGLLAGPGDTDGPIRQWMMAPTTSSCALVARGLLRLAGCRHPLLLARARVGHPMEDLEAIGKDAGAWVPARQRGDRLPGPGDPVVLESATGGHAFLLDALEPADGRLCRIASVDGGQKDAAGRQLICQMHRTWTAVGAGIVDDNGHRARQVHGWVDVERVLG